MEKLELEILPQPNETTCGPTCLQAVYRYYDREVPLDRVIAEVQPVASGGTLAVLLAQHALRHGFSAVIYTYNVTLFDPTWFDDADRIPERLRKQMDAKAGNERLQEATPAYLEFLSLGGELRFRDLTPALLREYLRRGVPILTGLSATFLYHCARERDDNEYDDIVGDPVGHFVVLSGYDPETREVLVADPLQDNPLHGSRYYRVDVDRLINAILLGIVTYDANLLILRPESAETR
ncbi:MAG TPA: C39 family peptidase [bacterium]|nr:C39 family peptidase [bacterium]